VTRPLRLAIFALAAVAFAARLSRLLEGSEPFGTDGYYYVVQAERLLGTGRLHVPDGSWVLPFLAGVASPFRDPVVGVKVGAALLAALCVPAAGLAGARLARASRPEGDVTLPALSLAAWAAVSPTLMQLAAEFPKALGVVAPGLLAVALAVSRPRGRALPLLAAALLAAAGAHRLGAAFVALGLAGAGLAALSRRREGGAAAGDWRRALGFAVGLVALFAIATLALPNLLHPADLERLRGHVRLVPGWPPPVPYLSLRAFHTAQAVELALPWVAAAAAAVAWVRRREPRPALGLLALPLAACLLPVWRDDVLDLGYRLLLMAPAVAAPLAVAAWPAGSGLRSAPRPALRWAVLAVGALAALPLARAGANPASRPPYERFRRVLAALPAPPPELLIAHQGMAFLYDHATGRDAMAWAPEPALDRRTIGRIAWGIRPGEWAAFAPSAAPPVVRLEREYAYVREDVWESFVARARAEGDDDLAERLADWRNPSAVRPRSLARNH
jgi:hypothetical protein